MRTTATATALLLALLLAGLAGCGGGGDATSSSKTAGASSTSTSGSTSGDTSGDTTGDAQPVGSAPQAVCDFADDWQPIDDQLTRAEGAVDDAPLWGDTADAMESVTAPEALTVWPVLATAVRKYADLLAAGDTGGAQAFATSRMAELERVHATVHDLFAQACP